MKLLLLALSFLISFSSFAVRLSDYTPYNYEVLFTNPICVPHVYETPIASYGGGMLTQKPLNAYCSKADEIASGLRPTSPQYRLIEWIQDSRTEHIILSALSFSNKKILETLCHEVATRNLYVTLILDSGKKQKKGEQLIACNPNTVNMILSGNKTSISYGHTKFIIVNPHSRDEVKIAFSSGNLSSGVVLHHENWHFITTNINSFFAQAHLCLVEGIKNYTSNGRKYFANFMASCKANIQAPQEEDIITFFTPGEGELAVETIASTLPYSHSVWLAAHRFSNKGIIAALDARLKAAPSAPIDMRLMVDDDIFWAGVHGKKVGPNMAFEYNHTARLRKQGMDVKYVETNDRSRLLHHNKYIIFQNQSIPSAVFAGAGNFTNQAFFMSSRKTNLENYYYITIPEVVQSFVDQYNYAWEYLGTHYYNMPTVYAKGIPTDRYTNAFYYYYPPEYEVYEEWDEEE